MICPVRSSETVSSAQMEHFLLLKNQQNSSDNLPNVDKIGAQLNGLFPKSMTVAH